MEQLKKMMGTEMDDHLGYEKSECSDGNDYRNGYKRKMIDSSYRTMEMVFNMVVNLRLSLRL